MDTGFERLAAQSVDQIVELAGILAGHLVGGFGRQVRELLVDVLLRFRPHPVGMREVGTHISVSTPISSISLVPTRSYWKVALHWARQYSLGSFFSFKSWY